MYIVNNYHVVYDNKQAEYLNTRPANKNHSSVYSRRVRTCRLAPPTAPQLHTWAGVMLVVKGILGPQYISGLGGARGSRF